MLKQKPWALLKLPDRQWPYSHTDGQRFTCWAVCDSHILLGSASGKVTLVDASSFAHFHTFGVKCGNPVCVVRVCWPPPADGGLLVAAAMTSGHVEVWRVSLTAGIVTGKMSDMKRQSAIHKGSVVTELHWGSNPATLYIGDEKGRLSVIRMGAINLMGNAVSLLFSFKSSVVQIEYIAPYLLVSTRTSVVLVNNFKHQFKEISLDKNGTFGACFFHLTSSGKATEEDNETSLKAVCAGPDGLVWLVNLDTYEIERTYALKPRILAALEPAADLQSQTNGVAEGCITPFARLMRFERRTILAQHESKDQLTLLDLNNKNCVFHSRRGNLLFRELCVTSTRQILTFDNNGSLTAYELKTIRKIFDISMDQGCTQQAFQLCLTHRDIIPHCLTRRDLDILAAALDATGDRASSETVHEIAKSGFPDVERFQSSVGTSDSVYYHDQKDSNDTKLARGKSVKTIFSKVAATAAVTLDNWETKLAEQSREKLSRVLSAFEVESRCEEVVGDIPPLDRDQHHSVATFRVDSQGVVRAKLTNHAEEFSDDRSVDLEEEAPVTTESEALEDENSQAQKTQGGAAGLKSLLTKVNVITSNIAESAEIAMMKKASTIVQESVALCRETGEHQSGVVFVDDSQQDQKVMVWVTEPDGRTIPVNMNPEKEPKSDSASDLSQSLGESLSQRSFEIGAEATDERNTEVTTARRKGKKKGKTKQSKSHLDIFDDSQSPIRERSKTSRDVIIVDFENTSATPTNLEELLPSLSIPRTPSQLKAPSPSPKPKRKKSPYGNKTSRSRTGTNSPKTAPETTTDNLDSSPEANDQNLQPALKVPPIEVKISAPSIEESSETSKNDNARPRARLTRQDAEEVGVAQITEKLKSALSAGEDPEQEVRRLEEQRKLEREQKRLQQEKEKEELAKQLADQKRLEELKYQTMTYQPEGTESDEQLAKSDFGYLVISAQAEEESASEIWQSVRDSPRSSTSDSWVTVFTIAAQLRQQGTAAFSTLEQHHFCHDAKLLLTMTEMDEVLVGQFLTHLLTTRTTLADRLMTSVANLDWEGRSQAVVESAIKAAIDRLRYESSINMCEQCNRLKKDSHQREWQRPQLIRRLTSSLRAISSLETFTSHDGRAVFVSEYLWCLKQLGELDLPLKFILHRLENPPLAVQYIKDVIADAGIEKDESATNELWMRLLTFSLEEPGDQRPCNCRIEESIDKEDSESSDKPEIVVTPDDAFSSDENNESYISISSHIAEEVMLLLIQHKGLKSSIKLLLSDEAQEFSAFFSRRFYTRVIKAEFESLRLRDDIYEALYAADRQLWNNMTQAAPSTRGTGTDWSLSLDLSSQVCVLCDCPVSANRGELLVFNCRHVTHTSCWDDQSECPLDCQPKAKPKLQPSFTFTH